MNAGALRTALYGILTEWEEDYYNRGRKAVEGRIIPLLREGAPHEIYYTKTMTKDGGRYAYAFARIRISADPIVWLDTKDATVTAYGDTPLDKVSLDMVPGMATEIDEVLAETFADTN